MFILFGATYHTFDSVVECAEEILLKGTGLTKRKSLVVVFRTNKVFLIPNGVIISLRQRSVVGPRQRSSVNRDGFTRSALFVLAIV